MKLGKYDISGIFKAEKYKTVYWAQYGQKAFFVHEYSDSAMADHEYEISARLAGCHVDQFSDAFKYKGKSLLVQELFAGISVGQYFNQSTLLPAKIDFARSVLSILRTIHDTGVIYNNLSLDNITIDKSGHVMLHNFLPATLAVYDCVPGFGNLTDPGFMAPERTERMEGKPCFGSDYYSFGITYILGFSPESCPLMPMICRH